MNKEKKEIDEMAIIVENGSGEIVTAVETAKALYNAGYRKVIDRNTTKVLNYEIESLQVEDSKIKCEHCINRFDLRHIEGYEQIIKNLEGACKHYSDKCEQYRQEGARLKELITKIKEMIDKNFYYDNLTTSGELSDLLKEYGIGEEA